MSDIINQNTEPLFIFDMPDDETLSETISVKGEKGEKGDPTKLSELTNDTGFITASTSALTNYYDKTTTDGKLDGKLDKTTFNSYEIPSDFFTGDETVTGTGSSITLTGTAEAVLKDITIYGDTAQNGTPTPTSPIAVKTVTGVQTISITGDGSQDIVVDLGSLELCKLGSYQDYIYRNDSKWYKHKAINKITIDGDETWQYPDSGANYTFFQLSRSRFISKFGEDANFYASNTQIGFAKSDKLSQIIASPASMRAAQGLGFSSDGSGWLRISLPNDIATTVDQFKDWLEANNITVYYALDTAVDEEITDTALIAQLNALAAAKTHLGSTIISVGGDLAASLSVEAFRGGWIGTISGLSDTKADISYIKNTYATKADTEPLTFAESGLRTPEYIYTRYHATGTSTAMDMSEPREQEGTVYIGNNRIVTFYTPPYITESTDVIVEEIDISTRTILRSTRINGLMHCNAACYNPTTGKIFVALAQYNTDSEIVYVNKMAIVDYATLTLDDIVTVQGVTEFTKIAYDANTDSYYIFGQNAVHELNIDTLETTLLFNVDTRKIFGTQGLEVRNGRFYIAMGYPRAVVVLSMTGDIEKIISIDDYDSCGHFFEFIADLAFIDDDNLLITPHANGDVVGFTRDRSSYYINYLCKLNLKGNDFSANSTYGINVSERVRLDTTGDIEGITYADGSTQRPLRLLSEALRSKFKRVYSFRITSDYPITYFGTLVLEDEMLSLNEPLTCEGMRLYNSNLYVYGGVQCNSTTLQMRGATLSAQSLKLVYNDANDRHSIHYSTIRVPNIYDSHDNLNGAYLELRGSQLIRYQNKYKSYSDVPNSVIESTLSVSGTTLTVDFSSYVLSTEFWPNAYLLAIKINSTGETITFARWQGFGDSRKFWDRNNNEYTVRVYDNTTRTITITGSAVSDIGLVTMLVL